MKKNSLKKPKKSDEILVTQGMLNASIHEVKSEITSLRLENKSRFDAIDARFTDIDSRFNQVDARFAQVDARFAQVDARFAQVDARFDAIDNRFDQMDKKMDVFMVRMDSRFEQVIALVQKTRAESEAQHAQNRFVLDGYASLYESNEQIRARLSKIEKQVFGKEHE